MVWGFGVNDAEYSVTRYETLLGKHTQTWMCPIYTVWKNMITRCYSPIQLNKHPTYIDCVVCPLWRRFSSFRDWMMTQDWEGKTLDKDLLSIGNRTYSPEFCIFIEADLNVFLVDRAAARGDYPVGVYWNIRDKKYQAKCGNPFTGVRDYLGYYDCPQVAHEAWRRRKHELACRYADQQNDARIAEALRIRYSIYREKY